MPNESRYEVEKKNSINMGSDEPYYIEFYLCVSHMGFQGFQGYASEGLFLLLAPFGLCQECDPTWAQAITPPPQRI